MEFSGNFADFYQFILIFIPISSCFFCPLLALPASGAADQALLLQWWKRGICSRNLMV
jgi:hypothetical protein